MRSRACERACEQGALSAAAFAKVRAFAMLGSSLEKTQYFFNVAGTTPSVSYDEWRGKAYEKLFSDDPKLLLGQTRLADLLGQLLVLSRIRSVTRFAPTRTSAATNAETGTSRRSIR